MTSPSADLADDFFPAWLAMARVCEIDPVHGLMVAMNESGVTAHAHNPNGHASGLIQFMPDTLRGLGWTAGHEAFRKLTATEQVPYVQKYWVQYRAHKLDSPGRIYLSTFLPALLTNRDSHNPIFVLCGMRGPMAWAYADNRSFDVDQKGYIILNDLERAVQRACHGPRWADITARLEIARLACGPSPEIPPPPSTKPELPGPRDSAAVIDPSEQAPNLGPTILDGADLSKPGLDE